MPVMNYKPTTPARRHMVSPSFDEITKFSPEKSLITTKKKHAGRNSYGKITVRHHGGGNKVKCCTLEEFLYFRDLRTRFCCETDYRCNGT